MVGRPKGPRKRRVLISIRETTARRIEKEARKKGPGMKVPTFIAIAVENKWGEK